MLERNHNIQKILKVTFQLKLQVFLLGINPENINEKYHSLLRYMLTAARTRLAQKQEQSANIIRLGDQNMQQGQFVIRA